MQAQKLSSYELEITSTILLHLFHRTSAFKPLQLHANLCSKLYSEYLNPETQIHVRNPTSVVATLESKRGFEAQELRTLTTLSSHWYKNDLLMSKGTTTCNLSVAALGSKRSFHSTLSAGRLDLLVLNHPSNQTSYHDLPFPRSSGSTRAHPSLLSMNALT